MEQKYKTLEFIEQGEFSKEYSMYSCSDNGEIYQMSIIDYSYFDDFPSEICDLVHLKKLYFTDDTIWERRSKRMNPADVILPETIGELRDLEELYLPGNGISTLPDSIGNLRKLKILNLERNGFKDFPNGFTHLKELEVLNVSGSAFSELTFVLVVSKIPFVPRVENGEYS